MENLCSFESDLLNRKTIAINLTSIIKFKSDLRVLAIDSSWGTGKTTFVNMWINLLNNNDDYLNTFETMYFNAWENDYLSDPLLSLLTELVNNIKSKQKKSKTLIDKAKPLAKISGQIALKYLTRGVLDNVDWNSNLEEGLQDISDRIGEVAFNEIINSKKIREDLKTELVTFQNYIEKKIIIFIDELDRCRPTFAIELLETIKHIFNLDNYVFVISLDKEQLSHSIKTLYGQGMDSDGYLRRFFDLEYNLPNNYTLDYINNKNKVIFKEYINTEYFEKLLEEIFISENYSLRDINKVYAYINILLPTLDYFKPKFGERLPSTFMLVLSYLYASLINLRFKHNNNYKKINSLDFEQNQDLKESNIITFDINSFTLNLKSYNNKLAKQVLSPVLSLYLELIHKSKNSKTYYHPTTEEMNHFSVGLEGSSNSKIDLLYFITQDNILDKLEFTNSFNI